jgi:hypothetical protein
LVVEFIYKRTTFVEQPSGKGEFDPRANGGHLKLDNDLPELLDRPSASGEAAIANEGHWLIVPYVVDVIESVLQHSWITEVVLGRDEDVTIPLRYFGSPSACLRRVVPAEGDFGSLKNGSGQSRRSISSALP